MTSSTRSAPTASKRSASNGASRKTHRLRGGTGEANHIFPRVHGKSGTHPQRAVDTVGIQAFGW